MKIEVSLYGTLAQYLPTRTQGRTAIIDCPDGVTVGQVIDQLGIPKPYPTMLLVNGIHADPNTALQDGDLLALFPPLAGGSPIALVRRSSCS
ncbi:MAG: MoaD/ThiS family protein [Candidatus Methylomirabilis oxyfera]|nr:MoaD/ThiS family protein [Candidatus Methylomirabilis oxyfera]